MCIEKPFTDEGCRFGGRLDRWSTAYVAFRSVGMGQYGAENGSALARKIVYVWRLGCWRVYEGRLRVRVRGEGYDTE